jgi:23S rRNA (cytidine1920-2'-O)/16S rRNA (cytidine1409-2'-O)-methyltransferase
MKAKAQRLDALLVERGLAESKSRAQGLILAGRVRVGDRVVTKTGSRVAPDERLLVERHDPFVSRAGEKLDGALDRFGIRVAGRACLVTVMERTNVRYLTGAGLPLEPELLVADLSFISLTVALESLFSTTPSLREAVVLVKPQFEAGPELVGRGGLVRDPEVHLAVIRRVAAFFEVLGFGALGVMRAPVAGRRAGNREYPVYLVRDAPLQLDEARIREVVAGG